LTREEQEREAAEATDEGRQLNDEKGLKQVENKTEEEGTQIIGAIEDSKPHQVGGSLIAGLI
jgi:hypothetical protein